MVNETLMKMIVNVFGYSFICVPIGITVYMAKNNMCMQTVQNNFLVKILVFGREKDSSLVECGYDLVQYDHHHGKDDSNVEYKPGPPNDDLKYGLKNIILLLYCFGGLQVSYLTWGIFQEKIMTTNYELRTDWNENIIFIAGQPKTVSTLNSPQNIRFHDSQFLVLINRILAFFFAIAGLIVINYRGTTKKPIHSDKSYSIAPLYQFLFCSLSNILSSWCQYEALKFVNFPTQVLSKACKILPVMIMSQIVGGKKYQMYEYFSAISISLGMSMFLLGNHQINQQANTTNSQYKMFDGLFVLALYLTFDSFTSNWQGKLFEKYKISSWQMMAAVNFYSIILTFTSLTQQGDLLPAFKMILSSSQLTSDSILLSLCSAAGQLFVFYTISNFGAIVFVTIMTLRQAFAILLSCFIYHHSLPFVAIIGIMIVFSTMFTQIYIKSRRTRMS